MGRPNSITNIMPIRDFRDVAKKLAEMQREIDQLKTARPYGMASRNFDGVMDPPAAGTHGWALTPAGVALLQQLIMSGDIRLVSGSLVVEDGGNIDVNDSGEIDLNDGSDLNVNDGGIFRLISAGGVVVMGAGRDTIPDGSGRKQQSVYLVRDNGRVALALSDLGTTPGHTHQQALAWFDRDGNTVVADDTVSGNGLANPYIPAGSFVDITPPTATTTSSTFVGMQWADSYVQHPKVTANVLVQTPAGTTGEIRMTVGGVQIGSVVPVGANVFTNTLIPPAVWPSFSWLERTIVQLEGRVTAGSGSLGVRCLGLWGVQT